MNEAPRQPHLPGLISEVIREAVTLIQRELALFRAELKQNVAGAVNGLVAVIAAVALVNVALILFAFWAVDALGRVVGRDLATFLVGGGIIVIALLLALYGWSRLKPSALMPDRTIRQAVRTKEALTERTVP
jgi:uncharacterized membrane protein